MYSFIQTHSSGNARYVRTTTITTTTTVVRIPHSSTLPVAYARRISTGLPSALQIGQVRALRASAAHAAW